MNEKPLILIIDDEFLFQRSAEKILGDTYEVKACSSGPEGLDFIDGHRPDLVLLDIKMIDMDGFEVIKRIHSKAGMSDLPVIFLTGIEDEDTEIHCFKAGAWDFVRKPFVDEVLRQRVRHTLDLSKLQKSLRSEVKHQTKKIEHLTEQIMLALSKAVDAKDHYTNGHSERVAKYSAEIARRLGKTEEEQEDIYYMGILHDVGKIGVHEDIINKPGRLTDAEFAEIKSHTTTGHEILKPITELPELATGARWHHERCDGNGYPDGLSGYDIPEAARIICVADCYDAMTSNRSYSRVRPQADVRAEIIRCKGSQFDPDIADIMVAMIDDDPDYNMSEQPRDEAPEAAQPAPETKSAGTEPTDKQPDELTALLSGYGLDTEEGLKTNGSMEDYIEALQIFPASIEAKSKEIQDYLDNKEYDKYTVKVHSLKTMSRMIGATGLSELARKLEFAGKDDDIDTIISDTPALMKKYSELISLRDKLPD